MIARIIVIIAALAVAVAVALVFLPIAAFVDPVTRAAAAAFSVFGIFDLFVAAFSWPNAQPQGTAFFYALWTVAVMICVAPVLIVALIGEAARTASGLFYVVTTGLVAAGLPWILRARHLGAARVGTDAGALEARLALLFFLTGACSGMIYWLIAGRGARRA